MKIAGAQDMKARVPILLFALVMASSAPAQSPPSCNPHFTTPCSKDFDFGSLVCYMGSYDPAKLNPGTTPDHLYSSPMCDSTNVPAAYLSLLKNAYALAPSSVQSKLCKLKKVFVTTDSSYTSPAREPLGIWEAPARGGGDVYIAIPDYTLDSASTLAEEENGVLARLLTDPKATGRSLPSFQSNNPPAKTPAAPVLAVLAHELGHILLADTNVDGTGAPGQPHPRPCRQPANKCFEQRFLGKAGGTSLWDHAHFHGNMRRWISFGVTNGNRYLNTNVDFGAIKSQINDPTKDVDSTDKIRKIYLAGLASVFAAVSPEEDFVETYKYKVLAAAKDPASGASLDLSINFPSGNPVTIDVLNRLRPPSGELLGKINCVP
jgi:hypothetical protein